MYNREQSEELVKRTRIAINCKYGWLAEDKKGDIIGLVWEAVMDYTAEQGTTYFQNKLVTDSAKLLTAKSETEREKLIGKIARHQRAIANPDPVPCVEFLKMVVRGVVCEPRNGIMGNKRQQILDREERAFLKVTTKLNILDAEETRYNKNFSEVSYDDYNAETGWEPSTAFIYPECMTEDEDFIEEEKALERERKVMVTKANPHFAGLVKLAEEHFASGGTMAGLGEKLGITGQTAKNRLQAAVAIANNPFRKPMPKHELRRFSVAAYVHKQENAGRMNIEQMYDLYGSCAPRKRKTYQDPRQTTLF